MASIALRGRALRAIAATASRRQPGARALRSIVEEVCHDIMFEAPERRGEKIAVDAASVEAHLARLDGNIASGQ